MTRLSASRASERFWRGLPDSLLILPLRLARVGQQRWLGVIVTHLVDQRLDKVRQGFPGLWLIELVPGR